MSSQANPQRVVIGALREDNSGSAPAVVLVRVPPDVDPVADAQLTISASLFLIQACSVSDFPRSLDGCTSSESNRSSEARDAGNLGL